MNEDITLEFISRQMAKMNAELRDEMRNIRDEMATMRDEIHVLSGWMRRTDERIRRLEGRIELSAELVMEEIEKWRSTASR